MARPDSLPEDQQLDPAHEPLTALVRLLARQAAAEVLAREELAGATTSLPEVKE